MAIVKFSRKEFEKYVKINEQVKEKIALFGTPLESLDGKEIEIEIFPNRPDLLSLQGYLRSFLAFLGKKTGLREYKVRKPKKGYDVRIDKSVESVRPFTACAIVKNLQFNDEKIKEIIDIQEKIHATLGRNRRKVAIGIYPLEKIKLPIRFEARSPGKINFIPLEADKEMNGLQILQRHASGREYAHLLFGMRKFPVFVDSAGEILSMPPIINSQKTGKITESTREVFIESSGFDLSVLKKTLNILVSVLADMGGEIYGMRLFYENKKIITPDLRAERMRVNIDNINRLLGLQLNEGEMEKLIERSGFSYKKGIVFIPAWRADILHEVDIAEDIAIAYGYDKIQAEIPEISTVGEENKEAVIKRKIEEMLVGLGFIEISSYHLMRKQDTQKMNMRNLEDIEIRNSKTEYSILRENLLLGACRTLSENTDAEYPQKIFEIGKVFNLDKKEDTEIKETEKIVVAITPGNFTEIKQVLDYLGRMFSMKFEIENSKHASFIDGRVGKIMLDDGEVQKGIGIIGEIHPAVLKNWKLKVPVAAFELSLKEIFLLNES